MQEFSDALAFGSVVGRKFAFQSTLKRPARLRCNSGVRRDEIVFHLFRLTLPGTSFFLFKETNRKINLSPFSFAFSFRMESEEGTSVVRLPALIDAQ